jgi:hypothetical protein
MLFAPDGVAGRFVFAVGARVVSGQPLSEILPRLDVATPPILMLDDPKHPSDQNLLDGYATCCAALEAVFEGRATDVSLN